MKSKKSVFFIFIRYCSCYEFFIIILFSLNILLSIKTIVMIEGENATQNEKDVIKIKSEQRRRKSSQMKNNHKFSLIFFTEKKKKRKEISKPPGRNFLPIYASVILYISWEDVLLSAFVLLSCKASSVKF